MIIKVIWLKIYNKINLFTYLLTYILLLDWIENRLCMIVWRYVSLVKSIEGFLFGLFNFTCLVFSSLPNGIGDGSFKNMPCHDVHIIVSFFPSVCPFVFLPSFSLVSLQFYLFRYVHTLSTNLLNIVLSLPFYWEHFF